MFKYELRQRVIVEGRQGTVVGRSEFLDPDHNMYLVSCGGVERQWNEAALSEVFVAGDAPEPGA